MLQRVYTLRRMWRHLPEDPDIGPVGATEQLLNKFRQYETNEEFLNSLPGAGGSSSNGYFQRQFPRPRPRLSASAANSSCP